MPEGCGVWDGVDAPGKPDEVDPWGVPLKEGRLALAEFDGPRLLFRAGSERFVDKFMINFPWTTRLSVDFLRSRVSISVNRRCQWQS